MSIENAETKTPVHAVVMRPEWVRAIAKAASSLRFTADQWEWMTPAAREESHRVADLLTEIENEYIRVTRGE